MLRSHALTSVITSGLFVQTITNNYKTWYNRTTTIMSESPLCPTSCPCDCVHGAVCMVLCARRCVHGAVCMVLCAWRCRLLADNGPLPQPPGSGRTPQGCRGDTERHGGRVLGTCSPAVEMVRVAGQRASGGCLWTHRSVNLNAVTDRR